ncbi:unnamed protein product [Ceutorhynchus assimilis]|uniref:Transposase n=1 Tax=Ceutorhynchus assimilis TaxID=467358 RepID=A0A9N9QQZ6_9CUCU|nr:unnamed protein product [Ceutorhynchus assimilis]
MYKEAEEGITIPLKRYRERTIAATKISKGTFTKLQKESCKVFDNPSCSFSSPKKKRPQLKRKLDSINPGQLKAIREVVYNFYLIEKRRPTLKLILEKIIDQAIIHEELSVSCLGRLLKKIGFRWTKTNDNRKALMEKHDIRLKRIKYLKQITEYRKENRPIIYTDETYIHSSHTSDKGWFDDSSKGFRKPISKGQRLIVLHAGGEGGFINNGLLIFRSGEIIRNYHSYHY